MIAKYPRALALVLSSLLLVSLIPVSVLGDEGMFLPDTLSQLPLAKLKQRGLKIPITDIYNPAGPSIKDAVVRVGFGSGYGTGEFVSAEGLVLTNHHVAFDGLVGASDTAKDYGTMGYVAKNRSEELPLTGYTITMTQDLKNVTADVLAGVSDATPPAERAASIQSKSSALETANSKPADGITARVMPMNEGLTYYLFVTQVLRDVRVVYAPPKNIGFFGGDPDNFEWPRHVGDFTFLRAYAAPDGKPSDYASSNVPYKPKKFLSLSMGGVKDNEFVMVMGYPGSTRRYRESYSVAYNQDVFIPFSVEMQQKQIEVLTIMGRANPSMRVKLQSVIFGISNELKNNDGSVLAMRRAGIVDQKRVQEAAFTKWISENPERQKKYGEVLPSLAKAYEELEKTQPRDRIVQEIASLSDVFEIAGFISTFAASKEKPEAERNPNLALIAARARAALPEILAGRNPTLEREMLNFFLRKAAELPASQKIEAIEKRFGSLKDEARIRAEEDFARAIVDSKNLSTPDAFAALFDKTPVQLKELNEPLLDFAAEIATLFAETQPRTRNFNGIVARWRPLLIHGMTEMRGGKPYPDANATLRFTYGDVKGYIPKDAAIYQPFTHLSGVVEKDTGSEPFDVPAKLKQLFRARDFGIYAEGQDVPVNFISTTDIIGGNSGSPILNGRGEQIGIVFDGNYEGLGNDFFYDAPKNRTISVDIRYVLFLTEKFGGAGYLLKEMDIKNAPAALKKAA
ncbi:MAG: S46 family peptidase [Pyrinomonadaceae bacterium]